MSQVFKYKAYGYTTWKGKNTTAKDTLWKEINMLAVLDTNNDLLKLYGKKENSYSLIKNVNCPSQGDDNIMLCFEAIDNEGDKAAVSILLAKQRGSDGKLRGILTIEYSGVAILYSIKSEE